MTVLNALFNICISNAHKVFLKAMLSHESISQFVIHSMREIKAIIYDMESSDDNNVGQKRKRRSLSQMEDGRKSVPDWYNKKAYEAAHQFRLDGVGHHPIKHTGKQQVRCFVCKVAKPSTVCYKCHVPLCINALGKVGSKCTTVKDTCFYIAHYEATFPKHQ